MQKQKPKIVVVGAHGVQWTRICLALTRAGLAGEVECLWACADYKRKYALADLDAMSTLDLVELYHWEFPQHCLDGRRDTLIERLFNLPAHDAAQGKKASAEGQKAPVAA